GNLTEYPTAKALWGALVTTYSSGNDKLQIFNLHVKANELKQNEKSLEEFWIALQGHGLDRKFNPIKREILRLETLPSAETAYATVRKESAHQNILGATSNESQGIATRLIVCSGETEGVGLAIKGYRRNDGKKPFVKEDKSHLTCEECSMTKHTKEHCFRIVGYPNWWTDGHKKGTKNSKSEKEKKGFPTIQPSTSNKENTGKGFGGLAAAGNNEKERDFFVTGQDGLLDVALKNTDYIMLMK
nr:hypothetical protein [Tanacetum cinerariifolium]